MANADVFSGMSRKGLPSRSEGSGMRSPVSAEPNPFAGEVDMSMSTPVMEQPPSTTATSKEPTIAPRQKAGGLDLDAGFYRGKGGYAYMLDTSGDITIKESPRGGAGTVVTPDSPFYDLIVNELAGRPATGVPGGTRAPAKSAPTKAAAPSGRASMAEKEAYADDLLGPAEKAGQYGSAATVRPSYADGETFTLEGPDITAPAKGQYGSMGALREAEMSESPEAMAKGKAMTQAEVASSDRDRRKEVAGFTTSGVAGGLKRAELADAAKAKLIRTGIAKPEAERIVGFLMSGVMEKGDFDSLRTLQAIAGK